jgi:hypothetical protein
MAAAMTGDRSRPGMASARTGAPPELAVRLVSALLALAVAGVHVADQGGITALNSPAWMGWAFRVIEVVGVLTALALLLPWSSWLGWAAGLLLGIGPFAGYIASRSVGVPGDHVDVGNWGYWIGTVSLIVEAALVILCAGMLLPIAQSAYRQLLQRRPRPGKDARPGRPDVTTTGDMTRAPGPHTVGVSTSMPAEKDPT